MLKEYIQLPRAVHILCFGMFLNRAGSFFIVFLTIYLREALGLSVQFATLTVGVAGLGSMIGSVLGGQLADQLGRRTVMLLALFGSAVLLVALSVVRHPTAFLIGIFLLASVADMYRPAASAMIGDLVPSAKRQYSFGLMYISINLGFAIAPPLGGLLAEYSWHWLFWGDALTTALFGLVVLTAIGETQPQVQSSANETTNETTNEITNDATFKQAAAWMLRDIPFVIFCTATFLTAIVFMQSVSTLPLALKELGITSVEYGSVIAINGVLIVALQLPLTSWLNRFDRMLVIAVGSVLIAVGFGLNAVSTSIGFAAITIVIWTFGEMFQAPFKQAVVTDLAPVELRGRYHGVSAMCYALAMTIGAPIGGAVMERLGTETLWYACLVIGIVAAVMYAALYRTIRARTSVAAPNEGDTDASAKVAHANVSGNDVSPDLNGELREGTTVVDSVAAPASRA